MHLTGLNYHDLLAAANVQASDFQAYIDTFFATTYNAAMWDGFAFDTTPMIDYTYAQFQAELKLNVMATYVNPDSPAKAQSTEGFDKLSGTIPTMKAALEFDSKEQRELMKMQMFATSEPEKVAMAELFKRMDNLLSSHVNSITYQRNQMVSRGKLELLDTNNPGGLKNISFSAQIPAANIIQNTSSGRWWTDTTRATEGTTADPIADLEAMIDTLTNKGIKSMHFEVDKLTLRATLKHSKVLTAIGYSLQPLVADANAAKIIGSNLNSYNKKKAALEEILGVSIVEVDVISSVETWNKATMKPVMSQIRGFAENVFTLLPDGAIGTIKHVMPLLPPANYTGSIAQYFNNSLLMKVYSDMQTNVQYFNTEQAVLTVINKPKYVLILNVK